MLTHRRAIGDTKSLFSVQLTREGVAVDLTDGIGALPVKFEMTDKVGNVVIAATTSHVTVSQPTLGYVEYDFQTADVAVAGDYYAYFRVYNHAADEYDTFPEDDEAILVQLFDPAANREEADPSIDIVELAGAPIRTRTVEGTVEERSVNELVKADQYAASKTAVNAGQPWGIRVARTRPGGMVT